MSGIKLPVRIGRDTGSVAVHIRDASNRIVAANLIGIDATEIEAALNTKATACPYCHGNRSLGDCEATRRLKAKDSK